MKEVILEMKNIVKTFPGVRALDNVNVKIEKGTIHSLVGENGAGKSTLMNVLSGVYPYGTYEGDIIYNGEICKFKDIKESETKGIVIIHQELALIPYLSIMENIFLGNEQADKGVINWSKARFEAKKLMKIVGLHEDPEATVNTTAALNDEDSDKLLNLILKLREERGMTAIIISHKLNEVTKVTDEITVIRDGASIETLTKSSGEISEDRIIRGMVGRDIVDRYPKRECNIGEVCFQVKDWTAYSEEISSKIVINHVNFNVRKGEVIGIAGLMGAGRTELAMSIFGKSYGRNISGTIIKDGKEISINSVGDAIRNGIAYVTEDRKAQGLILIDNIKRNMTLPSLNKISKKIVINDSKEISIARDYMKRLKIKAPSIDQYTGNLSGGNQQKVMLARWIFADPDILILDEPTRGIDVGAKYEIYCIINELASQGKSVIVISSELPEVLGISDRVYVMNEGSFVGELSKEEATQENVMKCIMQSNVKEAI